MRITVDASACTYLPICVCGWRGLPAATRGGALAMGRAHELRAHPGDKNALRALNAYKHRHAGAGA